MDGVGLPRFDQALAGMDASDFVERIRGARPLRPQVMRVEATPCGARAA
ncbi:hypothetical protein [Pseudofulvimonas gallinarii]|jgi:hypothetical protein|uniref:Uncharacterized protein n=1 Tax=Pseudofulvimonas gallinarii TaxID=634155 RepID=A0A4V2UWA5_9GAMM|nr:hypothetical protein [Pseudofulvimonas gallinarii]TCS98887.1 hypothetical protein EDC25_10784 [Pseudofulvimonas gallinarii]